MAVRRDTIPCARYGPRSRASRTRCSAISACATSCAISVAFLVIAGVFETLFHFLFVLAVTGLMLVAEILNTAVEALCDYVQPNYDDRIRHIKDMAAGATFIAIFIWYAVLGVILYELLASTELFSEVARP